MDSAALDDRGLESGAQHGSPPGSSAPALAHQFDDLAQQRSAAELGMWLFLVTEVMLFGGLFTAYTVFRISYQEAYAAASAHTNLALGAINTAVLLTSSLAMAMAVHAAERANRRALIASLAITIALGAVFLLIKGYEYYEDYHEQLVPLFGLAFNPALPERAAMFFNFYFVMTGVHAIHMLIGLTVLKVLLLGALGGRLLGERSTAVHVTGLYWHFVDIVWVFLFPLLYLVGVR